VWSIDFDPAKDAQNQRERGLPFDLAPMALTNVVGEFEDIRHDYGERRMVAFGLVDAECCASSIRSAVRCFGSFHFAGKMPRRYGDCCQAVRKNQGDT
jgi:uncharacterized DUF497 family protein